ncbi:tetratricopeptide repeat protein [Micromonospora yangpuensis]|uniref:tetratricopeptide repeat protein n=1 Tax=Micromonospora yangpuensis TaxID=683228 RepID=UPI001112CB48|nr:hypothetical protein [Micromonospora yangpuensis]GGL89354.1 hypothetical protein GCM10012279_03750 [Micromonospora yangpuensis]
MPAQLPLPQVAESGTLAVLLSLALFVGLTTLGRTRMLPVPDQTRWWQPGGVVAESLLRGTAGTLFGGGTPAWQRLGLALVALFCFLAWRRYARNMMVYRPGPIDVREFEIGFLPGEEPDRAGRTRDAVGGAAADGGDAAVDGSCEALRGRGTYLRSRFCRQLAETGVYPPYAGPSNPPPQGFFDVLADNQNQSNLPIFVTTSLARLWPTRGFQVKGTLQVRRQEPRYGLSVTVTSFAGPGGSASATTTEWGRSWEDATCRAAYWAMAKILPATRLADTAPWRSWRGRDMPAELFETYSEAKKRHDDRKLDEALFFYREALRLDPFNIDIRLMVASVQEDMGLFLDALQTYQGALAVVELDGRYTGALWSRKRDRWRHWVRYTWSTVRLVRRHPEWLKLRFQYARALGFSERVVTELFTKEPIGTRRRHVRDQTRERLCAALAERYWPAVLSCANPPDHDQAKSEVRQRLSTPEGARLLLRLAAWQEFQRLYEDLPVALLVPGAGRDATRRQVRLMRDVWIPLRVAESLRNDRGAAAVQAIARDQLDAVGCLSTWWIGWRRLRARQGLAVGWPTDPDLLEQAVRRAQRRWNPLVRLRYLDYYGAAVCYAHALCGHPKWTYRRSDQERGICLPETQPGAEAEALTFLAVQNLRASLIGTQSGTAGRLAVQSDTNSGVASRLRTWIASSDPDLERLRNEPQFRFFQQDVYQPMKPITLLPEDVTEVRIVAYTKKLLCEGARLLERKWHQRRFDGPPTFLHEVLGWIRVDAETWTVVAELVQDRARFWEHRARFSRAVTEAVELIRTADHHFPPPVPPYEDLVLPRVERIPDDEPDPTRKVDRLVREWVEEIDYRLKVLGSLLAESAIRVSDASDKLTRTADVEDRRFEPKYFAALCMERAQLWQQVIEILDGTDLAIESIVPEEEQTEP